MSKYNKAGKPRSGENQGILGFRFLIWPPPAQFCGLLGHLCPNWQSTVGEAAAPVCR